MGLRRGHKDACQRTVVAISEISEIFSSKFTKMVLQISAHGIGLICPEKYLSDL